MQDRRWPSWSLDHLAGFRAQRAAHFDHDQSRADAMTGDIRDDDVYGVRHGEEVEVVAADMTGGRADPRQFQARQVHRSARQKGELDVFCDLQFVPTLLRPPPLRHIGLQANVIQQFSSPVIDWRDYQFIPERRTILAMILQNDFAALPT